MKTIFTCLFLLCALLAPASAQTTPPDTDDTLEVDLGDYEIVDLLLERPLLIPEVTVRAFELGQRLQTAPASIGLVTEQQLRRFGNATFVQAVNTVPGVRMEERSPGSYRLAVRGSSLRAPFGVRNVKIYYNGIPFTDPGGHTYLNELGYYNIARMEIIKGPGSSLYGAGTGGVVLIESIPADMKSGFGIEATGGSYGLINLMGEARSADQASGLRSIVRYQHLTSDGYREHSAFRRDVLSWDASARLSAKTTINTNLLYTDLRYETPGALTLAEYKADPRRARPTVGFIPGSIAMNAAIEQKSFLAGATLGHAFNDRWAVTHTLYGAFTALDNPTIRNYGRANEPHAGGRALLKYGATTRHGKLEWLIGAEAQQGLAGVQIYSTAGGSPDTLQTDDKLHIRSAVAFTQGALEWRRWLITAGISINNFRVRYARLTNQPYAETIRDFNNEAAPRLALRYRFGNAASAYISAARGFSPPTSAELSPSGKSLNNALQAEYGWNYEGGLRGTLLGQRLSYDLAAYYFSLANTIVQRRDALGGDYFINSGSTRQIGAELLLRYQILNGCCIGDLSAFTAYTFQHFRYSDFVQLEADYSGNALPGVSPNTVAAGVDWDSRFSMYARLNYYYSDLTPLNDANDAALEAYHIFGARVGYKLPLRGRYGIDVFAGGDNLTDVTYSAGPDINGFGGRYYNAAPGRSFFAGVSLQYAR